MLFFFFFARKWMGEACLLKKKIHAPPLLMFGDTNTVKKKNKE